MGSLLRRLQGDAAPSTNGHTARPDGAAGEEPPMMQDSVDHAPTAAVPVVPPGEPVADRGIDPAELGPGLAAGPLPLGARRRRRDRRPMRVRTRATIRHLDLSTVIKVALVFWGVILVALVVASVMLWAFADAFGSLPSIEKSVRTLFSLKSFTLHPGTVAMYTGAVGIVLAVAGTLATVLFALIYNLIADVVGGIRVELETTPVD
jgi:hypothetical protein